MLNGRHPNSVLVFFECIFTYGRVDSCPGSMIVSTVTKKDKSGRDPPFATRSTGSRRCLTNSCTWKACI